MEPIRKCISFDLWEEDDTLVVAKPKIHIVDGIITGIIVNLIILLLLIISFVTGIRLVFLGIFSKSHIMPVGAGLMFLALTIAIFRVFPSA